MKTEGFKKQIEQKYDQIKSKENSRKQGKKTTNKKKCNKIENKSRNLFSKNSTRKKYRKFQFNSI